MYYPSHRTPIFVTSMVGTVNKSPHDESPNFRKDFVEFVCNLTMHCYHWMVEPKRCAMEKVLWTIVHLIGTTSLVLILKWTWENHTANPLVTTLYDTNYPVGNIPFPAVAVCNNNLLSLQRARKFAEELAAGDKENRSIEYYLEGLKQLAKIYDSNTDNQFDYLTYQHLLDQHEASNNFYNMSYRARQLAPQCDEFMLKCHWNGQERKCMENGMFQMVGTPVGFCCIFNYVSHPDITKRGKINDSFYSDAYGPLTGLSIHLNASTKDYLYPLYSFVGFNILIFSTDSYPDLPSGGVTQVIVQHGLEMYLKMSVYTLESDPDIRRYSAETRQCLLEDEMMSVLKTNYHRNNCIVSCRARSILALCGCVPFYFRTADMNESSVPDCTLENLPCLNHYRVKWVTLLFNRKAVSGVEKEFQDGLLCVECLPSCSHRQYQVSTTRIPLRRSAKSSGYSTVNGSVEDNNLNIVKIFFGEPETQLYKQSLTVKWFQIIGDLGGLCGIITGFSLISAVEIVYFVFRQLLLATQNCFRERVTQPKTIVPHFIYHS